jgi:hypothetical protein
MAQGSTRSIPPTVEYKGQKGKIRVKWGKEEENKSREDNAECTV